MPSRYHAVFLIKDGRTDYLFVVQFDQLMYGFVVVLTLLFLIQPSVFLMFYDRTKPEKL
jgi:uncharacterized membrane protein YcgQ (UPF0703/DUF1980 family)